MVRIEEELDKLIVSHIKLTVEHEGKICKTCGIIQGKTSKGFEKYYCEHLTKKIDKKLKKENKLITMKIIDSMYQNVGIIS